MDLKKIMALAMMALMVIPSLTIAVGADPEGEPIVDSADGAGLVDSIARARLYLGKVRDLADNIDVDGLYPGNDMIQGYLNQIYELLGQDEILLETTGDLPTAPAWLADEARIVIPMPDGFTLGDLETLSWSVNTTYGYPPHVDITIDVDEDGVIDPEDMLTAEMAVNQGMTIAYIEANLPGDWVKTFELNSGDGFDEINADTVFWVTKMGAGDQDAPSSTLGHWKTSTVDTDPQSEMGTSIPSSTTPVLKLEIEVDNWIAQTKAYVDNIEINGDTYDYLGAEGFLDQASTYYDAGKFNSSARNLAAARNILGRVKGLLTRIAKAHKVTRTERFMEQVMHRIEGIEAKVVRLRGRLGERETDNMMASMGLAKGKLRQLDANLTGNNVNSTIDGLEDTTELIAEGFGELDDNETSNTLEAIDRLEAKIRVLNASAERLSGKGYNTTAVVNELEKAEALLETIMGLHVEDGTDEAEGLLEDAENLVSGVRGEIRGIRKGHQDKGSKGKGKGQGN